MPHKRVSKAISPAPDQVRTLKALGDALGVTDDTITQWNRRGGITGPPYSLALTYLWARSHGLKAQIPRDPEVQRLIGLGSAAAGGTVNAAAEVNDLPGTCSYDRIMKERPRDYGTALQREKVRGEELDNEKRRIEIDKTRGDLVTKDEARRAATLVRDQFIAAGLRLPQAAIEQLGQVEMAASLRTQISEAVEAAWQGLIETVARG